MSDSPQYEAFRNFARTAIELEVLKATAPLKDDIRSLKAQLETRAVPTEGPAGKDGRDGKDGVDGKPGERGAEGPAGKDGAIGERGAEGPAGKDGAIGERGVDGLNGKDGAASMIAGPKGDPGQRGADGIATREELHSLIEERMGEIQIRTFADVYQGVYENGRTYERGQLVTWGGSLWLSQSEAKAKPGESAEWKLVVKKGADARK